MHGRGLSRREYRNASCGRDEHHSAAPAMDNTDGASATDRVRAAQDGAASDVLG
jgi:hypothetical protein